MIFDKFDKKDIAQMLSSIFIVLQVFLLPTEVPSFYATLIIMVLSLSTCVLILFLIAKNDFIKHLMSGIIIVGLFSAIIGLLLSKNLSFILISFSIGLPVATMVDALKD